jgi:GT2 family glycosyltransferase
MSAAADISVAVATMDRPAGLARCLDALLAGQRLPAEIIVVDQGRAGLGRRVVAERQIAGMSPVYLPQERRGLSASRNLGVAHARCPVVAVTDDDCVPDLTWVAEIERAFAQPEAPDGLTGRILPLGPETPETYVVSPRESMIRADFFGKAVPWLVGSGGNFAVKRDWFTRLGGCDERLGTGSRGQSAEDMDLFYRLLRAGAHIRYEPDVVVYHERQDKARRLASRWTYGYGIGAFCGLWLRRGDLYASYILGRWLLDHLRVTTGALINREWLQARQRMLSLSGTLRGLMYGLRVLRRPGAAGAGK